MFELIWGAPLGDPNLMEDTSLGDKVSASFVRLASGCSRSGLYLCVFPRSASSVPWQGEGM